MHLRVFAGYDLQQMQVVKPAQASTFADYCAAWLKGTDVRLRRAALQTYNLLAEAEGTISGPRLRKQLPVLSEILGSHVVVRAYLF